MSELKTKWPDIPEGWTARMLASDGYQNYPSRYERARAEAAIERLRASMALLRELAEGDDWIKAAVTRHFAAIGPIPESGRE